MLCQSPAATAAGAVLRGFDCANTAAAIPMATAVISPNRFITSPVIFNREGHEDRKDREEQNIRTSFFASVAFFARFVVQRFSDKTMYCPGGPAPPRPPPRAPPPCRPAASGGPAGAPAAAAGGAAAGGAAAGGAPAPGPAPRAGPGPPNRAANWPVPAATGSTMNWRPPIS